MPITDDPDDPRLTRGIDEAPVEQGTTYLVLSEAERAKGFVRPLRRTYVHVGEGGSELSPDRTTHGRVPPGCGAATTMGLDLAETYARQPTFYGGTYCVGCRMHRPVAEFRWDADGEVVGS